MEVSYINGWHHDIVDSIYTRFSFESAFCFIIRLRQGCGPSFSSQTIWGYDTRSNWNFYFIVVEAHLVFYVSYPFFPLFPKHGLKMNLFPIVSFRRHFKMNDAIYTNVTLSHMTFFDCSRHCHTWQRLIYIDIYIYIYIISEAYFHINNFNKEQHFKSENGRSNVIVDRNRPLEYLELVQVFFLHRYFCNNI